MMLISLSDIAIVFVFSLIGCFFDILAIKLLKRKP